LGGDVAGHIQLEAEAVEDLAADRVDRVFSKLFLTIAAAFAEAERDRETASAIALGKRDPARIERALGQRRHPVRPPVR